MVHLRPTAAPVLNRVGCFELELLAHAQSRVCVGVYNRTSDSAHLAPLRPVLFDIIAVDTGLNGRVAHIAGRDGAAIGRLHDCCFLGEYHGLCFRFEFGLNLSEVLVDGIQRHLIRRIARMSKVAGNGVSP